MASGDIDALLAKARAYLKDLETQGAKSTKEPLLLSLPEAVFWLEERNILDIIEKQVQIKDISQIKPDSRITIELVFVIADVNHRLVIRTIVTKNGIFQLRHSELIEVDYPFESNWEKLKEYAKINAVPLAGLSLSIFNASLTVMRLTIGA